MRKPQYSVLVHSVSTAFECYWKRLVCPSIRARVLQHLPRDHKTTFSAHITSHPYQYESTTNMSSNPKQRRRKHPYTDEKDLAWLAAIDVPVHPNLLKTLEAEPCEAATEGSESGYLAEDEAGGGEPKPPISYGDEEAGYLAEDESGHSSPAASAAVNDEKPRFAYFVDYRLKPIKLDEYGNKWIYTDTGLKITTELAMALGLVEPYCKGKGKGNGGE
jgi:hypothetical protein